MWRTHFCVPCRDFRGSDPFRASPHLFVGKTANRRHEWRRGTQECVRYTGPL